MPITLDNDRIEYKRYFKWYHGDLKTLYDIPSSLVNGLQLIEKPSDLETSFNYFSASSKYYLNALLDNIPDALDDVYDLLERMIEHWTVTGEYCLVVENGVLNTIRPDYVFPIRKPDNYDIIQGFYFIFPIPNTAQRARVIEYNSITGNAIQNERTFAGNMLDDNKSGAIPVEIQAVIYDDTGTGYYKDIAGMVRELNVRFALLQLALNSTAIPLIQIATEGIGGGLLGADGVTPIKVAGLGKSGIGLVVPPPFTGEEGGRYIERSGAGLDEAMAYIRMLLASLSVASGVPEYVFGVSVSDLANSSSAALEQLEFLGQSRIRRMQRSLVNTFRMLGREVSFSE